MQTNLLLPNPERTSIKRVLLAPGIVLVVLVAAFLGGIMWMGARAFSGTRLFHQTKTGWQQIPPALGLPLTLQVSSNGALWVHTAGMAAMSCWDGKAWKYYTRTNLGIKSGYINPDFVLDGEQVWAPTTEGMLHWDGQRWRLFKESARRISRFDRRRRRPSVGDRLHRQALSLPIRPMAKPRTRTSRSKLGS